VPVGWLAHTSDRPLGGSERRLLDDVAHGLGVAVHARAMRDDLQRARERLVLAREDERRRLRRDLHDGVGPALAGLTLRAATVGRMLPPDAADARNRMAELIEEIRHTVVDVRQLVEGLRPPALDELGLVGACEQAVERLAAGQLEAGIEADPLPPLPAAVEVAAYRIVVEGVTNAVRHAAARRCLVDLRNSGADLTVTVTDDGAGISASRPGGNGLLIMRERAEELGGTLAVERADAGTGVRIRAVLPFPPVPAEVEVAPTAEPA
jgi:signal transduction histidine kinase